MKGNGCYKEDCEFYKGLCKNEEETVHMDRPYIRYVCPYHPKAVSLLNYLKAKEQYEMERKKERQIKYEFFG
jgi:hypothetical protein